MKAWELLSDKSKWTQEYSARNKHGEPEDYTSPDACRWCAKGALFKCYGEDREFWDAFDRATGVAIKKHQRLLIDVNDRLGYEAVLAVLKEADV